MLEILVMKLEARSNINFVGRWVHVMELTTKGNLYVQDYLIDPSTQSCSTKCYSLPTIRPCYS